ncbi:hypothetical protein EVAR_29138_1 [Eumeta japonica]|uniref:Uncharacterized protein n=1 Tax=Eumeta variegata TaxID=151549 RepID=A0A4C1VBV6_EUMVA|nr:hypothetical protein EVAR_29138_1 [Eumeta japonica]
MVLCPPRPSQFKVAKREARPAVVQVTQPRSVVEINTKLSPRKPTPRVASLHERTLLIQRISCGVAAINDGQRFPSDFFIQPSFTM